MNLASRIWLAITLSASVAILLTAVLVRAVVHADLLPFADHFDMMRQMMGWGPDLATIYKLVDRALFLSFVVALALAGVAGLLVSRELSRSVSALDHGLGRFAQGRLDEKIPIEGPAEIRRIARTANHMADEVREAQSAERELVAGIAHDLAHPLTAMQGTLEAARDGLIDVAGSGAITRLLTDVRALNETLTDLRDVAAAEVGRLRLQHRTTDLATIAQRIAETYGDFARRKGIVLDAHGVDGVTATTDDHRLRRVIANLVINAVQATPPGGSVRLETAACCDRAVLRLEDGAGPQAAARIRAALADGAGAGLGLRVVRALSRALGATLSVREAANGAIVELSLPR